jgi:hypothetical protein
LGQLLYNEILKRPTAMGHVFSCQGDRVFPVALFFLLVGWLAATSAAVRIVATASSQNTGVDLVVRLQSAALIRAD